MTIANKFINARIALSYIVSEATRCIKPLLSPPVKGGLREEGSVELEWGETDGETVFIVKPKMRCTVLAEGIEHLNYECESETTFVINSYGGFDPTIDLPGEATSPYVDMALWLTRSHAANAIREAGVPGFSFRKPPTAQDIAKQSDDLINSQLGKIEGSSVPERKPVARKKAISKPSSVKKAIPVKKAVAAKKARP
jgi:hypothetical protein